MIVVTFSYYLLYTTLNKFPVEQRKELSDILAHVNCEDVPNEAIVHFLEAIFNEGAYTMVLIWAPDVHVCMFACVYVCNYLCMFSCCTCIVYIGITIHHSYKQTFYLMHINVILTCDFSSSVLLMFVIILLVFC